MRKEHLNKKIVVLFLPEKAEPGPEIKAAVTGWEVKKVEGSLQQSEYMRLVENMEADILVFADGSRTSSSLLNAFLRNYDKSEKEKTIAYWSPGKSSGREKYFRNLWGTDSEITNSPILAGPKKYFLKGYAGRNLAPDPLRALGYSLQKCREIKFEAVVPETFSGNENPKTFSGKTLWKNYAFYIPFRYLVSGEFFRKLFLTSGRVERDMVYRLLFFVFACFTFVYMPYASLDYGVTGDEFPDQRHAGYVLDYFTKGDPSALNQPKTTLHLYGISMQVVAEAICRWFHIDNYYETRHVVCALNGALGILFAGLLGMRWGGGLCGLLSLLLMFFTPRFFGHSMNNLKDIPFATGYIISVYYTVRLFDRYPFFHFRYILGLILGIALALGTRSGGLILYPMLFMYAGIFYLRYYGVKEFYKVGKYQSFLRRILGILLIVVLVSYMLAIALWPFALQKPLANVLFSLKQFTNYSIGLKTIFDGEQMMSNMLPWRYAPRYLLIGMPLVTVVGFIGYGVYALFKRKEFSLLAFFILFAGVFPIIWVIYKNSNLYGGIRHLLFVMPPLVVVAARFWQLMLESFRSKWLKIGMAGMIAGGISLPVLHMVKNHPNDYVYFNELIGGMKGAYGDYETDYYYNSLKDSYRWFRKHVDLPKDRKTIIVTNHNGILNYYFRKDTNVKVIYSRYYEKYAKDWDYGIFANVYINRHQLKSGLFPPEGTIYAPRVDGYPMSVVIKRETKAELEGYKLEAEKKNEEALEVFERYIQKHPHNEEVMARMAKLYHLKGDWKKAEFYGQKARELHPTLSETLYVLALTYLQENKINEAMAAVQDILKENAFSVDGYYLRGLIFNKLKKYKEAIDNVNKALSYRPNHTGALSLGAEILFQNGNYSVAAGIYQKLLKLRNSLFDKVRLADCYCRMKQYKQAEDILVKVNELQRGYFPALKVWLRIMIANGDWTNADTLINQMSVIDNDAEFFVIRALYYKEKGKDTQAQQMVKKALELDADNPEALRLKKTLKGK